jgi:hypothetical protein
MMARRWKTGELHQSPADTVEAMLICVNVDCSGYSVTMRTADGAEREFELRPDLAKALAEGLAAALHEYGGIGLTPRH